MKRKISTKIISLVLVLTLMFSLCATTIGATTDNNDGKTITNSNDDKKTYVSIGDSMTNGYGLEGYEPNGENYFGFLVNTPDAYPNKVAEKFGWDLVQIATSGLRADDIYYLLNYGTENAVEWDDYGIEYMVDKFDNTFSGSFDEVVAQAAAAYQQAIKDADIISVNVGSNNFATLMHMRMSYLLGLITGNYTIFGGYDGEFNFDELVGDLKPEVKAEISKLYEKIEAKLFAYAEEKGLPSDYVLNEKTGLTLDYVLKDLANAAAYTTAGFVVGYAGIMETINRENPTAEVIVVELTNWFSGRVFEIPVGDGEVLPINVGDLFDDLYDYANSYMALTAAQYSVGAVVEKTPAQIRNHIDVATAQINSLIDSYNAQIAALKVELNNASGALKKDIKNQIAALESKINTLEVDLESMIADRDEDLAALEIRDEIDAVINETNARIDAYNAQIIALKAELNGASDALAAEIDEEIKAIEQNIDELNSELETAISDLEKELAKIESEYAKEITKLPAQKIYFAEVGEDVELIVDEIVKNSNIDLDALYTIENADDRFAAAVEIAKVVNSGMIPAGTTRIRLLERLGGMVLGQMGMTVPTLAELDLYESLMAQYDALGDGEKADLDAYAPSYGAPSGFLLFMTMSGAQNIEGCTAYLGLEKSMIASMSLDAVNVADLTLISDMGKLMDYVFGKLDGHMGSPNEIAAAMIADPVLMSVDNMIFSFLIGDGVILHPSVAGHQTIADAIIKAYEEGHTVIDESVETIVDAAIKIAALVAEYYDEAYAYAYDKLDEEGYIKAAIIALGNIKEEIKAFQNELDPDNFDAEYRDLINLIDDELELVLLDIDALIDLILEADELDAKTYDKFMALCTALLRHLDSLDDYARALEKIAGVHTSELVAKIVAELEAIHGKLVEKVTDLLENIQREIITFFVEELPEVFDTIVNVLVSGVAYYSHEAAKALYYWLYNNPETVIDFFVKNGAEIVDFFTEYGQYIVYVLGYIAENYGEEIVCYVLDNADVILPALAAWYAIHGELIWDLVVVYIDALVKYFGIEEAIHNALQNASDAVKEIVLAELNALREMLINIGKYTLEQIEAQIVRLLEVLKDASITAAEFLYAEFQKLFAYASKVTITPKENPYYVAVDSGNAGYAELVADALGLSNFDVTTWDDLDYEALAEAGFITVGFNENELSAFALGQMIGYLANYVDSDLRTSVNDYADEVFEKLHGIPAITNRKDEVEDYINSFVDDIVSYSLIGDYEVSEMDWAAVVGAENVGYVYTVLAQVEAALVASGIPATFSVTIPVVDYIYDMYPEIEDEIIFKSEIEARLGDSVNYVVEIPVIDTIMFAMESYLYGFVEFSVEYAELVHYILMNNPEASVVLLSAYNAFDMEFDVLGYPVNFGSAYDYVAEIASVQPKVYALAGLNVGYADISDAQTLYSEYVELGLFSNSIEEFLVWYLLDNTLTDVSDAGNYYICEQIMNALIILEPETHEHVYDNVCDCYCNICGEYRVVDHVYDNACDRYCNVCNEYRITKHEFSNDCDAICNICGAARTVPGHKYDNACDATCNICGDVRVVPGHEYDNNCDKDCNVCGAIRPVPAHVYDNACDADCNVCGYVREVPAHAYDNACDADCNECGVTRPVSHIYDNACDAACNVCGATRPVSHTYDNACDAACNVCGATRTPEDHVDANKDGKCDVCGADVGGVEPPKKPGLGAGPIIAIILGSTVGAGAAGGSVYWFVVKKKSFADLLTLVKGLGK